MRRAHIDSNHLKTPVFTHVEDWDNQQMSADLFAEFGSSSQDAQPRQQQAGQSASTHAPLSFDDPFSFLAAGNSNSTSSKPFAQPTQQLQQPWLQPQQQQQPSAGGPISSGIWDIQPMSGFSGGGMINANGFKNTAEDDDGWGDFEVATPDAAATAPPRPAPGSSVFPAAAASSSIAPKSSSRPLAPRDRVIRASTLDIITKNLADLPGPTGHVPKLNTYTERPSWELSPSTSTPQPSKPKNSDPNVLFDADDYDGEEAVDDDDDEFGDFETVAPASLPPSRPTAPAAASIIDFGDDFGSGTAVAGAPKKEPPGNVPSALDFDAVQPIGSAYPQPPKSSPFKERNPFPGLAVTTPKEEESQDDAAFKSKIKSPSPVTAWPTTGTQPKIDDAPYHDSLDSFDSPMPESQDSKPVAQQSSWDWNSTSPDQAAAKSQKPPVQKPDDSAPPPTNVPPPSILLAAFCPLLELPNNALFKPTATAAAASSVRSRVLADPATATFLRGYLSLATVAARVLAGRRLRWQRDKFLAQGMSISTNCDDARLRSAVSAANSALQQPAQGHQPPLPKIPELVDKPGVQTAKMVPTAPKACVICGLKRDERVRGADFEVEDSFGEWWVEHWGHRACRNFWVEHEVQLRQR
ncbi:hypothetical protein MAPG_00362 [Magnaporthiopsis poae ATCC 64411]|uniref:Serine/threonine-protein kinase ppk6 n=1 Tax=Magnaporthiopsis poae (strain ATCC 64411 / 73-15) TaxID=644358 RepID=A0A0C4DKT2_MAGP6|nr:hypothetical protein MAPG_00362 [Magnaporthiopsis poae ATCC 64411]